MKFQDKKDVNPRYLLLTLTIICVGLIVVSYFANDKVMIIKEATAKVISPLQQGINNLGIWVDTKAKNLQEIEDLNKENERLKEELSACREQITIYQNELIELDELRKLYELDTVYPEYNKTAANVFAKDSSSWFSVFYIDKGEDDGIYKGANVMCDDGLAGIVTETYGSYSKVRAIIDDSSDVSARIMPSNALCTVEGNINTYSKGYLKAVNIDKDAAICVGDKVVTSQISERFQPGILIGYVSLIEIDSNNLTITAYIKPAVSFDNIGSVLVITDELKNDIRDTEE